MYILIFQNYTSCLISAGVGRTGTYIVLDNVLDQIEAESVVDIDGAIVKARNQRMKLVQTKVEYCFSIFQTVHCMEFTLKYYKDTNLEA